MAKTQSITRNQNHDEDASSEKDNGGVGRWSDINHDLLILVMKQPGVVDYLSFGCVCKSWRSLAISNRNTFMASKPPMTVRRYKKACYLEDFEGRKFKTILPRFVGGVYAGLSCGYLIIFKRTNHYFWFVNPITRHELCFKDFPINYMIPRCHFGTRTAKAILVFSLSIRKWVFLVTRSHWNIIWYSIAGTSAWDHVSSNIPFIDLCAFKGTIYTLNHNPHNYFSKLVQVHELKLNPKPKMTLLETKNSLKPSYCNPQLVSSGENIYVMDRVPLHGNIYVQDRTPEDRYRFQELDFGEMKWVMREKTLGEYASFLSNLKHGVVDETLFNEHREQGLLVGHNTGDMLKLIQLQKVTWYFPHQCLNVDEID